MNITKLASQSVAVTGDVILYTINLNISGSAASNVQVQDVLPSGMDFVQGSESDSMGASFVASGSTLTWTMPSAGPCSCSMTYQAQVNGSAQAGSQMTNNAVLTCPSLPSPQTSSVNCLMSLPSPTPTAIISLPVPTPTVPPLPVGL